MAANGSFSPPLREWVRAALAAGGSFLYFCTTLAAAESIAIGSLATAKAVLLGGIPAALAVALLQVAEPTELRRTFAHFRAARRWAAHRCPTCDHPMPPNRFDGPCAECGVAFSAPRLPASRARQRLVAGLAALLLGCAGALAWMSADVSAFRTEVAARATAPYARARWWPAGSAGFTYSPTNGVSAHD